MNTKAATLIAACVLLVFCTGCAAVSVISPPDTELSAPEAGQPETPSPPAMPTPSPPPAETPAQSPDPSAPPETSPSAETETSPPPESSPPPSPEPSTAPPTPSAAEETPAQPDAPSPETSPQPATPSQAAPSPTPQGNPTVYDFPVPSAPGTETLGNEKALIDTSNKSDGYIMVKYLAATTQKLLIIITGPDGTAYQYVLNNTGSYDVFPLSAGNGTYDIVVYEHVSDSKYSTACTASLNASINNEFSPFLRPNKYVNFTKESKTVKKASELARSNMGLVEKIGAIYNYIINNITYDKELAQKITAKTVTTYVPDVDSVLKNGKGICFDYAALMTAMLRSQGIPTKLAVGHAGDIYHAWIKTYSKESGWIDNVIYFDGSSWKLMDPTFAASSGKSDDINADNYAEKYWY